MYNTEEKSKTHPTRVRQNYYVITAIWRPIKHGAVSSSSKQSGKVPARLLVYSAAASAFYLQGQVYEWTIHLVDLVLVTI